MLAPGDGAFEALETDPWGEALNNASQEDYISDNLTVSITEDKDIFVNGAALIYPDLIVANRVDYPINNVLNSEATFNLPVNGTDGGVPAFEGPVTTPAPTVMGDAANSESSASLTLVNQHGLKQSHIHAKTWDKHDNLSFQAVSAD
ncbi:uncharacterized protein A1O9_12770 [Exophiala aquamarina CBS 119918]|uniref:Uncharacterized protein n=1 Tax=Exophiala aquamarina CBS 119918 TaxID=1182545 RepID=A0A072NU45_9EURO|nr:uncharacterized protein A1O9_12770 [Exophiala aquamarina CBS 119918]KEF51156.1 hypothetical protein A1O9_12770 [Exophiala aquamarina CBS 119918]